MTRWLCVLLLLATAACSSSDDPPDRAAPNSTTTTVEPTVDAPAGWQALDPGPLHPREGAALVWTGAELVVWGGPREQSNEHGYRDGAAYDPATGDWRTLSRSPLPGGYAVGTWTDGEVVLWTVAPDLSEVGRQVPGTRWEGAAWDPATDRWRQLAASPPIDDEYGAVTPLWTGDEITVTAVGLAYDPGEDRWRSLPPAPVEGEESGAVWTGDEVLTLVANRSDPTYPAGEAVALAFDADWNRWRQLPPTGVGEVGTSLAWDGEGAVAVDYEMQAARYEPVHDEWVPLPPLPFRFYECSPTLARLGDTVLATHCSGDAILNEDGHWAIAPPPEDPAPHLVTAADEVFGWWSSDESYNFADAPITYFQSRPTASLRDGDLAATRTIPVGTVLLDLADDDRLTTTDREEEAGGLVTRLSYDVAVEHDVCHLESTYAPLRSGVRIANDVQHLDGVTVDRIRLEGVDVDRNLASVARIPAGLTDGLAHVLLEETTSDVLDIACLDLTSAEDLLAHVHR